MRTRRLTSPFVHLLCSPIRIYLRFRSPLLLRPRLPRPRPLLLQVLLAPPRPRSTRLSCTSPSRFSLLPPPPPPLPRPRLLPRPCSQPCTRTCRPTRPPHGSAHSTRPPPGTPRPSRAPNSSASSSRTSTPRPAPPLRRCRLLSTTTRTERTRCCSVNISTHPCLSLASP
jgi:hypothetical protein